MVLPWALDEVLPDGQRRRLDEALEIEHSTHPWRERLRGHGPAAL